MSDTIILQRVVAHYRVPLFRALYEKFGWRVVASSNPPSSTFLNLDRSDEFIVRFPFEFPQAHSEYKCHVPVNQIIDTLQPRRVISEFSFQMNSWQGLAGARMRGRIESYALWSHGWNMGRGFQTVKDRVAQYARLLPMLPADCLLSYSDEGARWLKKTMPWKKVISIGNTLDVEPIISAGRAVRPVRYGSPQILCIGRLTKEKRMDSLVRIFAKIAQVKPEAALTIIGDGPERGAIERQISSCGLGSRVHLTGALYNEDEVAQHCIGADFYLLPGAAGLSVNHALAYNLPVIAYSRGPGLPLHHPEIVYVEPGVSGLLCSDPSEDAMASLILRALKDGSLETIRSHLPKFVQKKLRLEAMLERFAEVDAVL